MEQRYSVTLVHTDGEYETEMVCTGYCLPAARHHAERAVRELGYRVTTRRPTVGRIATDKNNIVWHVVAK